MSEYSDAQVAQWLAEAERTLRERDAALHSVRHLREALAWALDTLDGNDAFIQERLPDAWALLDHDADTAAKQKARLVLAGSGLPAPQRSEVDDMPDVVTFKREPKWLVPPSGAPAPEGQG